MYTKNFVSAIKVNGKTMREFEKDGSKDIYLPFGSDYSLYLKNLDSRRAVVSIEIDGEDVLDGSQVVIDGNSSADIEGVLNASSNVVSNKFRFIEKTEKVRDHLGEGPEDGLIRVAFQFEEPAIVYRNPRIRWPYKGIPQDTEPWKGYPAQGITRGGPIGSASCSVQGVGGQNVNNISANLSAREVNDEGITVAGAASGQQFGTTHVGRLAPEKHVMVFRLRGETGQNKIVSKPVVTRTKVSCPTCGTKSKSDSRFCSDCSTALV